MAVTPAKFVRLFLQQFFGPEGWHAILFGLGWKPQRPHRLSTIDKKTGTPSFYELSGQADRIPLQNPALKENLGL